MKTKKSKKADLERKKHGILMFSLAVAAGFMLMAFEWASQDVEYSVKFKDYGELIEPEPIFEAVTILRPQTNIPPKAQKEITKDYTVTQEEDTALVLDVDTTSADLTDVTYIDTMPLVVGDPDPEPTFQNLGGIISSANVSQLPEYEGGLEGMYAALNKHLKKNYLGLSGKVYIEFVVEKDGTVSQAKVVKGKHEFLNNNALQAVKKLDQWSPGVQNYHEVRVRMVLPINFTVR